MTVQIVRDWVVRFNDEGPRGLINRKAPGQPKKLNAARRRALIDRVEQGPVPALDGVVRWRLCDLRAWLWEEYRVSLDETTIGRELAAAGYAKLSARPRHHAQDVAAGEAFKKLPRHGGGGPESPPQRHQDRDLVAVYGSPPVCKKKRRSR